MKHLKHLEFKRKYLHPLLSGKKRLTIRKRTNLRDGDEVYIHCGGKIIGKGRIISVRKKKISELTEEEAKLDGFESLDELMEELEKFGYGDEVYVVHFEFEPLDSVNPHTMYYGDADLNEIAEKSLKYLKLDDRKRRILEAFLKYGSIRRAAAKLGSYRKRGEIRKVLRECYTELKRRNLI